MIVKAFVFAYNHPYLFNGYLFAYFASGQLFSICIRAHIYLYIVDIISAFCCYKTVQIHSLKINVKIIKIKRHEFTIQAAAFLKVNLLNVFDLLIYEKKVREICISLIPIEANHYEKAKNIQKEIILKKMELIINCAAKRFHLHQSNSKRLPSVLN